MYVSTETLAPFSRASEYLTGPPQKNNTAGNLMPTQDRHGLTPWLTSTPNGLQLNSLVNVKNQTFFSGSDLNNGVLAFQADSSTTKFLTQPDGDTAVTCSTIQMMSARETEFFTHSPTLIRSNQSFSESTLPQLKAVNSSRKSGTLFANLHQRFSRRTTLSSLTRCLHRSQMNPTSDVSGNTIVSTSSDLDLLNLLTRKKSLKQTPTLSANGLA